MKNTYIYIYVICIIESLNRIVTWCNVMHIFCEPICCPSCWASLKEDLRKLQALHWICMDLQCYFAIMLFRSILTFSACSLQWAPGWLCSASLSPWSSALDAWAGDPTSGACSVSYAVKISYSIACLIALQNDEHVQLKNHSPRGVSIARNARNAGTKLDPSSTWDHSTWLWKMSDFPTP